MGMKAIDLSGQKFGLLRVIERVGTDQKTRNPIWLCECECKNVVKVLGGNLRSGNTKSCGCGVGFRKGTENPNYAGGHSRERIYKIWVAMKTRCCNSKFNGFKHYGGRGISICDEWINNFDAFYEWSLSNGYQDDLTIDRKDVNGNYEPSNCRWATPKEQGRNTRRNIKVEIYGKVYLLCEVAEQFGIDKRIIYNRYHRGDRGERLIRPPRNSR